MIACPSPAGTCGGAIRPNRRRPPPTTVDHVPPARDTYVVRPTAAGPACVAWGPRGLVAVQLGDPARFEADYARRFGAPPAHDPDPPADLLAAVDRALGAGSPGDLPIDWRDAGPFQVAVLTKTAEIPIGEVRPYTWVAAQIGRPRATRAVGTALARNPLAVVFPCHRVVRADGRLGRYGFGTAAKRALLRAEGADPDALEEAAARGVRFVADRASRTICYPSCARARSLGRGERIELTAVPGAEPGAASGRREAASTRAVSGWAPCPRCRPVLPATTP